MTSPVAASHLAVEHVRDRSVVTRSRSVSPLRLLAPAGTGRAAWVYQSSLGGGFVGGDRVALRVDVSPGASLFLSSQASSKVYRAARGAYVLDATVGEHASCVVWPDPIACFAGAELDQVQRFGLAPSANLVVVDSWSAGRVARGERWAFTQLATRLAIAIGGRPVLDDAMLLSPAHGELASRLGDRGAFATVALAGPRVATACDRLAAAIATRSLATPLVTASRWPWGLVARIGASHSESLSRAIREMLGEVAFDLLGADPWDRKW